jgi:hypothetical protein
MLYLKHEEKETSRPGDQRPLSEVAKEELGETETSSSEIKGRKQH